MNRRRLPFAVLIAVLVLLIGGGAALLWRQAHPAPAAGPLTGATIGGAFALTDQDGRTVTAASFAGRYPVYYFGYTYCPDVCPVDVSNIAQALELFEHADPARAARVQPVFVSVDPERDTPAVLKTWLAAFGTHFIGLTGTPAQIDAVKRSFKVFASKSGTGKDYLVSHSAVTYLFGPDGKPISFVESGAKPAVIAAQFDEYVR